METRLPFRFLPFTDMEAAGEEAHLGGVGLREL